MYILKAGEQVFANRLEQRLVVRDGHGDKIAVSRQIEGVPETLRLRDEAEKMGRIDLPILWCYGVGYIAQ